tara:strand:- start:414 stop:602 length:189 start_codon:yes stop_codon:yes gene_type:complete
MEDNVKDYDFPDFGPDDDTEDMTGVSIYDPYLKYKDEIPNLDDMPELPPELDIDNNDFDTEQ